MDELNQNIPESNGENHTAEDNPFSEQSMKTENQSVTPPPAYTSVPFDSSPYQGGAYNTYGSSTPINSMPPPQNLQQNMNIPPQGGYQPFPPPVYQQQNTYYQAPPRPIYQPYYPNVNSQPVLNGYSGGYVPPNSTSNPDIDTSKKKLSRNWLIGILFFIGVMIVAIIMMLISSALKGDDKDSSVPSDNISASDNSDVDTYVEIPIQEKPTLDSQYYADEKTGLLTTTGVAKRVSPSVVGIQIYGDSKLYPVSAGSGIILSEDGYIITNAHVLDGAKTVKVMLSNEKAYVADIIGIDSKTDLAVVKINETGLTPADMGNAAQLELGEQVAAIGNAGGFSGTITFGYVSGLDREITSIENGYKMKCIQTDAAVSPGNSGGALVNMYGQVVGIVSSKYVAEGYEGIGFAISMNEAKPIIEDIISKGYISGRVRVGIQYIALTEADAEQLGVVPGLLVREISADCDIANTDLQVDDIITELNGKKVYSAQTIREALDGLNPGDVITAKVYRKSVTDEVSEFEISFKLMQDTTLQ
jgi:serine protease Do